MTYLITFTCYGTRLHGSESGSVDREHNLPGMRLLEPNPGRVSVEMKRMAQGPYRLDQPRREIVLASLLEVCSYRKWSLLAAHVRSNHVHVVVEAAARPEEIMNTFKAYASRELNSLDLDNVGCRRWSRHGSTRYLWNRKQVETAIAYVAEGQGEMMAAYVNQVR